MTILCRFPGKRLNCFWKSGLSPARTSMYSLPRASITPLFPQLPCSKPSGYRLRFHQGRRQQLLHPRLPGHGLYHANQHPRFQHLKHDWIEFQLAHAQRDKIRAAYNEDYRADKGPENFPGRFPIYSSGCSLKSAINEQSLSNISKVGSMMFSAI